MWQETQKARSLEFNLIMIHFHPNFIPLDVELTLIPALSAPCSTVALATFTDIANWAAGINGGDEAAQPTSTQRGLLILP